MNQRTGHQSGLYAELQKVLAEFNKSLLDVGKILLSDFAGFAGVTFSFAIGTGLGFVTFLTFFEHPRTPGIRIILYLLLETWTGSSVVSLLSAVSTINCSFHGSSSNQI
jgi:hypothetical protein